MLKNEVFIISPEKRKKDADRIEDIKTEVFKGEKGDSYFINRILDIMSELISDPKIEFYLDSFSNSAENKIWHNILCDELLLNELPKYVEFYNMYNKGVKLKNDIELNKFYLSEFKKRISDEYNEINVYNKQTGLENEKANIDSIIKEVSSIIAKEETKGGDIYDYELFKIMLDKRQVIVTQQPISSNDSSFNPSQHNDKIRALMLEITNVTSPSEAMKNEKN